MTLYTVDAYGRRTVADDPNRGTWSFTYNPVGELLKQIDAGNNETTLTYDRFGRVKTRNIAGQQTTWTYDIAPGKGKGQKGRGKVYMGWSGGR